MRWTATIAAGIVLSAAVPAAAQIVPPLSPVDRLAAMIRAAAGVRAVASRRWQLPAIDTAYERPAQPRLRIRGKKVKLRVPLG